MNRPDIIFIVLDTQRADRLGCYGHERAVTPNLDRFAAESVLFEQAVAPAQWTVPSHASMLTGLYPTVHGVTQSSHRLSAQRPHLAEILQRSGYETIGFCNNPLVGILNNGLKRGFQTFYNYGGAIPSRPPTSVRFPWPLKRLVAAYTQLLRRISYPIQNFFGQSDLAFRLSLNAWTTPLWSKLANFKGQNALSVQDVVTYLQRREQQETKRPLFLFLNLMETHLPFWPPGKFVDQVAPYFRGSKEARTIMGRWNREAYRWAAPLSEPLDELESRVLSDMYDAEVAYQDDYLGDLFAALDGRTRRDDTLTVIVADHGDGLGEHGYMGHAFVAYEELVHVPFMLHWPAQWRNGRRVETPVSTRRIFHTVLDAAGDLPDNLPNFEPNDAHRLSLQHTLLGRDPERGTAFSEVYPPLNFVKAIEQRQPHLLASFRCLATRRAVVRPAGERNEPFKLIHVNGRSDELFNLHEDPRELNDVRAQRPSTVALLDQQVQQMAETAVKQRDQLTAESVDMQVDEQLTRRLRGLGYLD